MSKEELAKQWDSVSDYHLKRRSEASGAVSASDLFACWEFLKLLWQRGKVNARKHRMLRHPILAKFEEVPWAYVENGGDIPYHWGHVDLALKLKEEFPDEWLTIKTQQRLGVLPEKFE